MTIKQKLLASFLFVSLSIFVFSFGINFVIQEKIVDVFQEVSGNVLPGNIALSQMTTELYHTMTLLDKYEETLDNQILKDMENGLSSLHTHLTTYKLYHGSDDFSSQVEQLIQTFSREVVRYEIMLQKKSSVENVLLERQKIDNLLNQFTQTINPSIKKNLATSYRKIIDVQRMNEYYRMVLLAGGAIILIFTIFLSIFISKRFSTPLSKLQSAVQNISEGELDIVLPVTSKDEIGVLSSAFNNMTQNLRFVQHQLIMEQSKLENRVRERTVELQASNETLKDTIEELNHTQSRLIETEKMASLGGLVAGVAHEINTPLGICITAASAIEDEIALLRSHFQAKEVTHEYFESYIENTESLSKLFNTNLKFSAGLINNFKQMAVEQFNTDCHDINLFDYISEVVSDAQSSLIKQNVSVDIQCNNTLTLYTSSAVLYQIITALISNSLTHAFDKQPEKRIVISILEEKNNIKIQFQDNGKGISDKDIQQVFEPFFTTRRGHKDNSGLGLSIIYNLICSSLKGKIKVQSTIGEGTVFSIDLPIMSESDKN